MDTLKIFAVILILECDAAFGDYCNSYTTKYARRYTDCGFFYWSRCTKYRSYTVSIQVCCPGWRGSQCSTPICNNPCMNGGKCVGPERCQCPSSFIDQQCSTHISTQSKAPSTTTRLTTTPESATTRSSWRINGNETSDCVPEQKDVLFLVDSSTREGVENFKKMKTFIKQTVGSFNIGSNKTRVGLVLFKTNVTLVFPLDRYNTSQDVQNAVENITYAPDNKTNIAKALEFARTQGFTYDRPATPNIIFLITDGYSSDTNATQLQASLAKENHTIQIVATAVGQYVDFDELVEIASQNPYTNKSLFYSVDDFDDLHVIALENVLTSVICGFQISSTTPMSNISTSTSATSTPCYNKVKNCDEYQHEMCTSYKQWALLHCSQYCGFCQGLNTVPSTQASTTQYMPCLDTVDNCHEYGSYICNSTVFRKWTKDHCSHFCGLCGSNMMISSTPSSQKSKESTLQSLTSSTKNSSCYDSLDDCDLYSKDVCSSYRKWAMDHCNMYCGFCDGTSSTPSPCVDVADNCDHVMPDMCTSASHRNWATQNCAKFCKLC